MDRAPQASLPSTPVAPPETLLGLLRHYSPSGSEADAVGWLVQRMHALGYTHSFRDEAGNAVGVLGDGPDQIVLLGHIDTVPGEIPVRLEEDVLYGRGSVDAKGALSVFTDAVAEVGAPPTLQFVVIGAVGEEGDSEGARHAATVYRPRCAIIGEPSGWDRITLGYKGSAAAEIRVRRRPAHTAAPVPNACEAAIEVWRAIQDWASTSNGERQHFFDQVVPSLREMRSGREDFLEWAQLRIGVRLPPDILPQEWYRVLEGICGQAEADLVPQGFAIPAYRAEKNTSLVRAFVSSIRAAGGTPGFLLKTGTADLNIVAPIWGCPGLAYGPGDSSLDHTPDEHVSIQEYDLAVRILVQALRSLMEPNGST